MARAWGINSTMGELFALLYITGTDWTADDLRNWLGVSRGNVSMNLRELLSWGVVHKVHRPGERRELFRAETDVWTLFRKILTERKRRELDPSLRVLDRAVQARRGTSRPAGAQGADRTAATVFPAHRCAGRAALRCRPATWLKSATWSRRRRVIRGEFDRVASREAIGRRRESMPGQTCMRSSMQVMEDSSRFV